jgi:DNA-binding transcriptional regulator YdaS (Cro superfamily)
MARKFPHPLQRSYKDAGLAKAIEKAGGQNALARLLGINESAISRWARVPVERLTEIERLTGVPKHELRPELYHNYSRKD